MRVQELENAVAVENLELQEQQSDRRELEETLVKLEKHKDKLVQQIKTVRQLCYEESQQVEPGGTSVKSQTDNHRHTGSLGEIQS